MEEVLLKFVKKQSRAQKNRRKGAAEHGSGSRVLKKQSLSVARRRSGVKVKIKIK